MGWQLARTVIEGRPARPGPEWWTLLDLAETANDRTGYATCGHQYLMDRGGISRVALGRRFRALRNAGWLTPLTRPAPGAPVTYQITIPGAQRP